MRSPPYQIDDRVALIRLDAPPVNALGYASRVELVMAFDAAIASRDIDAIVLYGGERVFSCGADLREFGTPEAIREPNLPTLIDVIERSAKPVVAAVGSLCMGGGLELALACHFRVVRDDTRISFPEVTLGLLPGAGGTQRLPRAVGVERAVNLILSGRPAAIAEFSGTPLVDEVARSGEGRLLATAIAFARRIGAERMPIRRLRDIPVPSGDHDLFFDFVRGVVAGQPRMGPASLACIEAVEAASTLEFDAGLAKEKALFWKLMDTSESRGLRHAFAAERVCDKIPDIADAEVSVRDIAGVGVVGAGTMGTGIALAFLDAGIPVLLVDSTSAALERAADRIRSTYEELVSKGRLSTNEQEVRLAALRTSLDYDELSGADLIIEAVFEDIAAKEAVFRRLDTVARPGAILASNTSMLDVNRIAACTSRPADVLGLHFFSPANVMKLLEVVRAEKTAPAVVATAMRLARRLGKTAVVAGACDGFIGNRMVNQYLRTAELLVEAGALPQQVDRALEEWGMAMGPFRMTDMAGNDIGQSIRARLAVIRPDLRFSGLGDRLCERGRFGQKTGSGWYRYPDGQRRGVPDPQVDEMISDYRVAKGIVPRIIGDGEIVERCIYSLINEGARLLDEGVALRASDIDVVYLAGYGFPRHRGGPMHYAEEIGLYRVARRMKEFASDDRADAAFWTPAPLLARRAADGRGFDSIGEAR